MDLATSVEPSEITGVQNNTLTTENELPTNTEKEIYSTEYDLLTGIPETDEEESSDIIGIVNGNEFTLYSTQFSIPNTEIEYTDEEIFRMILEKTTKQNNIKQSRLNQVLRRFQKLSRSEQLEYLEQFRLHSSTLQLFFSCIIIPILGAFYIAILWEVFLRVFVDDYVNIPRNDEEMQKERTSLVHNMDLKVLDANGDQEDLCNI